MQGGGPLGGSPVGSGGFNRGEITRGFQSHHIISWTNEATKNHDLLQRAGFDLNSRANMIFLPRQESQHPTRTIHDGRHTTSAMTNVAGAMDKILGKGEAEHWSKAQFHEATRVMLSEFRQDLRAGNIALNAKQRPWAKL